MITRAIVKNVRAPINAKLDEVAKEIGLKVKEIDGIRFDAETLRFTVEFYDGDDALKDKINKKLRSLGITDMEYGDLVRIKHSGNAGTLVDVGRSRIVVKIGDDNYTVSPSSLEKINKKGG